MEKMLPLETAIECARIFSVSTEINCAVLDNEFNEIFLSNINSNKCLHCKYLSEITGFVFACRKATEYGVKSSERFGGKYIYFCPSGLAHFTSPIVIGGKTVGYLKAGPVLIIEKSEYIDFDLGEKYSLTNEEKEKISEYLKCLDVTSPEKVNELSKLLFITAIHIGGIEAYKMYDFEKFTSNQNKISEYIQSLKDFESEDKGYPIDKEKELLSAIRAGDRNEANKMLNEILGYIYFAGGNNFKIIKSRILELIVLLSRAAMEGGADPTQIFGMNYLYLDEINRFNNIEDLSLWLTNIMNRFSNSVFNFSEVKHSDIIFKSVEYIKQHYKEKIILDEVAAAVFISPSYFSKIFKDEMKINFSSYLNKLRIEKSKALLLVGEKNLADIAIETGFEDQSYFSKVFRKITGMAPGKFRESRGISKSSEIKTENKKD